MFVLGFILGLATAVVQSCAYLFSRILVQRGWSMIRLLVISHVIMGVLALPLQALVWSPRFTDWRAWIGPVAGSAGFYALGQASLLTAMRFTQPSRIAPLLGIKIIMLATIASLCNVVRQRS